MTAAASFARFSRLLDAEGAAQPRLIVDLDAVDHNLAAVEAQLGDKALRLVEKSLPCGGLLSYLMARAGTQRLMSFHLPFLLEDARRFTQADLLLGKPMPVAAARAFYAQCPATFDAENQVQWLIDTPARLAEYGALASAVGMRMRVVLEIDIGLHRGGFAEPSALDPVLAQLAAHDSRLVFSGFMGYDAHVGLLPRALGRPQAHADAAMRRYAAFVARLQRFPALSVLKPTFNTGGSPSYPFHRHETVSNEIALGGALLQPSGFDRPALAAHRPALFIAAPVLKATGGLQLPGLPTGLARMLGGGRETCFIYGGQWMAEPCWPAGLKPSALYGRSSNQELLSAPSGTGLKPGDWVFLRPRQSEAVLLQFGEMLAVRGDRVEARWPVYPSV